MERRPASFFPPERCGTPAFASVSMFGFDARPFRSAFLLRQNAGSTQHIHRREQHRPAFRRYRTCLACGRRICGRRAFSGFRSLQRPQPERTSAHCFKGRLQRHIPQPYGRFVPFHRHALIQRRSLTAALAQRERINRPVRRSQIKFFRRMGFEPGAFPIPAVCAQIADNYAARSKCSSGVTTGLTRPRLP